MPPTLGRSAAPTASVAKGPRYLPRCWNASITFAETNQVNEAIYGQLYLGRMLNAADVTDPWIPPEHVGFVYVI